MNLTRAAAEQAGTIFNAMMSVEAYEVEPGNAPDLPIVVFSSLPAKNHYEVSEWGEAIQGVIRKKNPRARFDLQIHGNDVVARTNISHETATLVVIMTWWWLPDALRKTATFNQAILVAATAPDAIAAK